MVDRNKQRPSEWERLFSVACSLIDQVQEKSGQTFGWTFGGGTLAKTLERLEKLNPEFVSNTIGQLMIAPDYLDMAPQSLTIAKSPLGEVLAE